MPHLAVVPTSWGDVALDVEEHRECHLHDGTGIDSGYAHWERNKSAPGLGYRKNL